MRGSTLGFLTDRDKKGTAYTYDEIVEALIPPMLDGYRFTGNEINVISGNGMPVKKGKYRKITELVKGFSHTVGGPVNDNSVARMKCQASWAQFRLPQHSELYLREFSLRGHSE